jgi:hypothetical protein
MNTLRIVKFWTTYVKAKDGVKAVDMVEYCAPGMAQRSTTVARIDSLSKIREDADADNIACRYARDRWAQLEPAYQAWKKGHEIPANGTPLGAWPGITPEQADVFKTFGLRSVEDIAEASSSVVSRVQLPGVIELQRQAQAFLAAKDTNKVAEQLAVKDAEITDLRDQLEELRQLVIQQSNADDDDADGPPRRRGRPPKSEAQAA